jgi:hypothetical protein
MRRAKLGLTVILLFSPAAFGQLRQQGPKLVGSGAVGAAHQGGSVAMSADGNTTIVGGFADDGAIGAAWVWTRSASVWTQQGPKLVGSGAVGTARQGVSVALSADGNTAIVGGYVDADGVGAAWAWTRAGGVWTQQGSKLVGSGAVGAANQGFSVALSADGNTAMVGGPGDDGGNGATWVWTRSGGVWTQQGGKLVAADASALSYQGGSVALSSDGSTAIVGGPGEFDGTGAAWVWTRAGGVWTRQGAKLIGSGAEAGGAFGGAVALSADGSTAMVGGSMDGLGVGAVWVWTRTGGVWTQQGGKLVGSGAVGTSHQGGSVSLSADGNTAIVGGSGDGDFVGATWVWMRSGGEWTQQGSKLVGSDAASYDYQGSSVALSADGSAAIVGGPAFNDVGASWIFSSALSFYPLAPCRLLDTRNADGPLGGPALAATGSRLFMVTGTCGIPADARALSTNVTVTQPADAGNLVVHAGDEPTPAVPTIFFRAGLTRANNAILRLATDGSGTVNAVNQSPGTVHVIVDVNGFFR